MKTLKISKLIKLLIKQMAEHGDKNIAFIVEDAKTDTHERCHWSGCTLAVEHNNDKEIVFWLDKNEENN